MAKKKKDIGKGIRALLSNMEHEAATQPKKVAKKLSNTVAMIPLADIEVNPFQPRKEFDETALNELAASIKVHGLIQPITVRRMDSDTFQLISGERRMRASKLANLDEVPAYIRLANDNEMMEMALVENIQREELNSIEIAITYQRLMDEFDLTHDKLSKRVGKNRSTVTNYLRLLKLPPEIQQALKDQTLSMGHARALVGIDDTALQLTMFKQVREHSLSVRALEELIRSYNGSTSSSSGKSSASSGSSLSAAYKQVQNDLSSHLEAKVKIKSQGGGKGQIVINFSSDTDLNRLLDIIEE